MRQREIDARTDKKIEIKNRLRDKESRREKETERERDRGDKLRYGDAK